MSLRILLLGFVLAGSSGFAREKTKAFPTAEGFGAYARGGRGGEVVHVTTLADSGPGSLREAICKPNRTIVFDTGGTIRLKSRLNLGADNLTIAGQTAPGGGVCLAGGGIVIRAKNIIIQHLRVRPGHKEGGGDAIWIYEGSRDVIIDHVSATWSNDEAISLTRDCRNVTVQWCIISEALNYASHAFGAIIDPQESATYHHNLLAHNRSRNPRTGDSDVIDFRNNVIYNWSYRTGYNGKGQTAKINIVGNTYQYGLDTDGYKRKLIFYHASTASRLYAAGNLVKGFDDVTADNWKGMGYRDDATESQVRVNKPFRAAPVTTQKAEVAYEVVLRHVGASIKRDEVDLRIVKDVRNNTGHIINHEKDVGGWPTLAAGEAPTDTDRDGMPDDWERAQKLDPKNPDDRNGDPDRNGYTHLEEHLHSLTKTAP